MNRGRLTSIGFAFAVWELFGLRCIVAWFICSVGLLAEYVCGGGFFRHFYAVL